uniref:Protein kinase domain-containing protein n=1 Tax=Meloidogyne incognita TaxID=6306 RepID=A0A914KG84_MELIC
MYNLTITTCFVLILIFCFICVFNTVSAFNLYIESDEMNRTLGISARMDYVTDGVINEYSTKFPYRLAENISRLRFTWSSSDRMTYYSLQANSQHFDVVPIVLISPKGYVPNIPQQFQVEYRCVGARSGQFRVNLNFNITTTKTSLLQLTLKQEKICSYREGRRRAFAQDEDSNNHLNINDNNNENNKQNKQHTTYSTWPLFSFISLLSLPCQLLVASVSLFALVCSVLLCCCYCIKQEEEKEQQQQTNNNFSFRRRRSKIGSLYNSTRSSLIRRKILFQQGIDQKNNNKLINGGSLKESSTVNSGKSGLSKITTTGLATINSCTTASSSSKTVLDDEQRKPLLDPQMPSTSAAALQQQQQNKLTSKIIYERSNQQVDVNQALIELNADRNLFEQCHKPEMEGHFGQLVWANWRQIGLNGNRPVVDEVDDGEDDAKEDTALICKTLKPDADRIQFECFLRSALQFHYVPPHPHLAQVIAAATFGNFLNPDSVRDLPLICYAHDGFGILKNFLHECREQAINVSLNNNNKKSSSVSPGVVVKSWAKRFRKGSSCSGDGLKDEEKKVIKECDEENKVKDDNKDVEKGKDIGGGQMENPRIVVTNSPSSSSSTTNAPATTTLEISETTTTLRIHNLVLLASQIVSAVRHLHKFGIIHKDIATRNCLVSHTRMSGGRVRLHSQLCDSALGSDLFPQDYKKEENNLQETEYSNYLPIRWMAPELFNSNKKFNNQQNNQNNIWNSATDVWACGILIWEIFNCGKLPYNEIHEDELEQAIVYAGLRLSQPYNCPDELYSIMCSCWTTTPEDRPTSSELDLNLQEFMQRLSKYI